MSAVNLINENDDEREIASQAACALRESFITAAQSGSVMYVENDHLMSKTPNRTPIVIKRLEGRNPDLARRFAGHGTFKIKKRKVSRKHPANTALPSDPISLNLVPT